VQKAIAVGERHNAQQTNQARALRALDSQTAARFARGLFVALAMAEQLPSFRYHMDPIRTGSIEASNVACLSCKQARGYLYVGPAYSTHEIGELICPWCIADGSAAAKFDATFVDSWPLAKASVPRSIIEEVTKRTPGYNSWQQDEWLSHCNDACVFHGRASPVDVKSASPETVDAWKARYEKSHDDWQWVLDRANSRDSVLYKFICDHCQLMLLSWDLS
jgi:uncharacterized protein